MKKPIIFIVNFFVLSLANVQSQDLLWAKQIEGTGTETVRSVAVDGDGNVYTLCIFNGMVDANPGSGVLNFAFGQYYSCFVMKLDHKGNFIFARLIAETGNIDGKSMTVDVEGNIYTTGSFSGTSDFDPSIDTFNLSSDEGDAFISKLDRNGNFVWAKQMHGQKQSSGYGISVDVYGNIYTTGLFIGKVDFDPGIDSFNITSAGYYDIFILKLDKKANFLWAKALTVEQGYGKGISILVDRLENVYVLGTATGIVDFDPGQDTFKLACNYNSSFFLKLNPAGEFIWAYYLGDWYIYATSIAIDERGNFYATGIFSWEVDFDLGPGIYKLKSSGNSDAFILKMDSSGKFIWVKSFDSYKNQEPVSICVDNYENVFTCGRFNNTVDFDPGPDAYYLTGDSTWGSSYISKLDSKGNFIQVFQVEKTFASCMALDPLNNAFLAGMFFGTPDFDPGENVFELTCNGTICSDAFIEKLITRKILSAAVYPNPNKGIMTIDIASMDVPEINIHVIDILGKEVLYKTSSARQTILNIENLPAGIYFIRLMVGNELLLVEKVIKE